MVLGCETLQMFAVQDAGAVLGYIAPLDQGAQPKEPDTGAKSSQESLRLAAWTVGCLERSATVAWTHGLVEVTADDVSHEAVKRRRARCQKN